MQSFDVAVIGAGAAGMMCAAVAGQRGRRVVLVDHAERLAEKIRISGGGRCNFTNLDASPAQFLSENPDFCRSALARYTARDFIALVERHGIAYHEKHKGQLFCDDSSERIIAMLQAECEAGRVSWRMPCRVRTVRREQGAFVLETDAGPIGAAKLVVATGGLSIPKIGASDFGYRLARQFGLAIVPTRPALVPLTFDADAWKPYAALSGVSLEVGMRCGSGRFLEDMLFTHRGLSGPAVLQISSYWTPGAALDIDLLPEEKRGDWLVALKAAERRHVLTALAERLPQRLAETWLAREGPALRDRPLPEAPDRALRALAQSLKAWHLVPTGTEGYRKAEVTAGGVDTRELSSATLEARRVPGLHFIGEVVDVTGWLGGYNFQWAWSSGVACGRAV